MSVIALANPEGGGGKTTAALLLDSKLASHRAQVTIIDAERWILLWSKRPSQAGSIRIMSDVTADAQSSSSTSKTP